MLSALHAMIGNLEEITIIVTYIHSEMYLLLHHIVMGYEINYTEQL